MKYQIFYDVHNEQRGKLDKFMNTTYKNPISRSRIEIFLDIRLH